MMEEIGRFGAVLCAQLAQNTLHMLLHRLLRDMQSPSNLAVTRALADGLEDLVLPCRQLCKSIEGCRAH
jgi:hypothetical protein